VNVEEQTHRSLIDVYVCDFDVGVLPRQLVGWDSVACEEIVDLVGEPGVIGNSAANLRRLEVALADHAVEILIEVLVCLDYLPDIEPRADDSGPAVVVLAAEGDPGDETRLQRILRQRLDNRPLAGARAGRARRR
jgi:hypothetical protein